MPTWIEFKYLETIEYADGTPTRVTTSEGARAVHDIRQVDITSKNDMMRWAESLMDGEDQIESLLFRHRRDPTHNREKYKGIYYKVTDAWPVEYLDKEIDTSHIDDHGPIGTT